MVPKPTPPAPAPAPPEVKPDDPVLTIKNYCPGTTLEGDACKTVITKAQFEEMANKLQPGMPAAMRRNLATAYSRMLPMSSEAEQRGLDKTPHFEETIHFARMQILSQELSRKLQEDAGNVSDQDIQDYYQKNTPNYEQATFIRIFVPRTKRTETPPPVPPKKPGAKATKSDPDPEKPAAPTTSKAKTLSPEEKEKASVEAMQKEAELLRKRLIAGEDADKLEKAAFTAAGLPGNPSPTKMENVRRTSLPPGHQKVMDLKPGEVSDVISDAGGNYIYKLVSKDTLPLEKVKKEIHDQIASQRYREAMQKFQGNNDLNDAYFGPARGPGMPTPPRGPRPPGKGKDKEDEDRD
jgi:hypothetical protein